MRPPFFRFVGVFVYDRDTGMTRLASAAKDGGSPDSNCLSPSISADGRFVAFMSDAKNLVSEDLGTSSDLHVFIRDFESGVTELVSTGLLGPANFGASLGSGNDRPGISADGRFVTFTASSDNLVDADTNNVEDVFVRDVVAGNTRLVSAYSAGIPANAGSSNSTISADGRFVAFSSFASNLTPHDTNDTMDVFVVAPEGSATLRRPTGVSHQTFQQTIDGILEADCLAEALAVEGRLAETVTTIQDVTGTLHMQFLEHSQNLSGTGFETGAAYQLVTIAAASSTISVAADASFPIASTFTRRFRIEGNGPAAGTVVEAVIHVTINANGQTTVEFVKFSGQCLL